MKILVTGATGFVGSHLTELLSTSGHQVFSLVRNKKKFKEFNISGTAIHGNLSTLEWVDTLPKDLDCVIHAAGVVHSHNKDNFYKFNTKATKNLIGALKNRYHRNLVFCLISSQAAAGPSDGKFIAREDDPPVPISHYGRSKLSAEKTLESNAPASWKWMIIRPPMAIGPADPAILDIFKMVKRRLVPITGLFGRSKCYSFVAVFDLVLIITKAVEKHEITHGQIFYAAHPQTVRYDQIIESIKTAMGIDRILFFSVPGFVLRFASMIFNLVNLLFPTFNPRLTRDKTKEILAQKWTCSGNKAKEVLELDYKWDLEKIIIETYRDYITRGCL
ncbi:MAG: NAD-dependent epimerase/dehydratase family protein [Bacteriovoracaceae bacterium]|nr:NAD-dependent epimerase/dehydratase family protein [Bacteriovoracaceae bacterium]